MNTTTDQPTPAQVQKSRLVARIEKLFDTKQGYQGYCRILDISYTAWGKSKQPNSEDGGLSDWFTDTLPSVEKLIESAKAQLISDIVTYETTQQETLRRVREALERIANPLNNYDVRGTGLTYAVKKITAMRNDANKALAALDKMMGRD